MNTYQIIIAIISAISAGISFMAFRQSKKNKEAGEMEKIKTELAVLTERVNTDISSTKETLDKLDQKIDQIFIMLV